MNHSSTYGITIPTPCHENWDQMTPKEQGRFCAVCSKVVTDFTQMSNEEILNILGTIRQTSCGRMNDEQLYHFRPQITLSKKTKLFLYALAIAFFSQAPLNAISQSYQDSIQIAPHQLGTIIGKVTDDKGKPLDYATIKAIQNGVTVGGAKTDHNGNFKITPLKSGNYLIRVAYIGFENGESENVKVVADKNTKINFKLVRKKENITIGAFNILYPKLIAPANPGRKVIRKSDLRHMGG